MIRITTNGILHNYKSSLNRSATSLNDARQKVLTERNFNSYADDPSAATQAFQLRRSYARTSTQITNNTSLTNKFESAYSTLESVSSDLKNAKSSVLTALSDSSASERQTLGTQLNQTAQSIIQTMNTSYNESYIFSGSDGLTVPFTQDTSTGDLLYCGVKVDSSDTDTLAKLDDKANQTNYIDIGLGMKEDSDGNLISSSAFNSSISGIDVLGYGVDEDGDPKNAISIVQQLSDIFSRCDATTGTYASDEDKTDATRLSDKLADALSNTTSKYTDLSTKATYLSNNATQLTDNSKTLNTEITSLEDCKLADAITSFSWAQYCYNAALKVGNSILSNSLMDYMD